MSFMDTLKDKLGMSKAKTDDMMRQHGDKVDQGIDKAGQAVDSKTGGKHSDQVQTGVDKTKDAAHKYGEQDGGGQS
ncbi:antitoxin [Actinacidiphila rubida]|uniref:MT0933-like antitoxin protein n=1 Tax=Actinacidiphila rubida TaxID=310780 RepID=A0A1H8G467_9ACTN|nr:antitoxin [Actinacidiphila rubida]SEN38555.1 MT0933-like antitoxin protein [Actinacidiphila rubida]